MVESIRLSEVLVTHMLVVLNMWSFLELLLKYGLIVRGGVQGGTSDKIYFRRAAREFLHATPQQLPTDEANRISIHETWSTPQFLRAIWCKLPSKEAGLLGILYKYRT